MSNRSPNICIDKISQLINISGRQRMLSQRIAFLILGKLNQYDGPLKETIKLFEESHNTLTMGNDTYPPPEKGSALDIYYFGDKQADLMIKDYVKFAKQIDDGDSQKVEGFIDFATNKIVALLNGAVVLYEEEAKRISTEMTENIKKKESDLVKTFQGIMDISKQTKMMSINSSIMAARAGEAGKEFTVVGIEMQKLTAQIDLLITNGLKNLENS